MSKVYITGHRNPDLDSLCSAYAYAKLKNQIDPKNEYIAVRCGHINESVRRIFANMEAEPPVYKRDIIPKVEDILLSSGDENQADALLSNIADSYSEAKPSVIPIFEGKSFYGLLSVDDVTSWVMKELADNGKVDRIPKIREIMKDQEAGIDSLEYFEDAKARLLASQKRGLAVYENDTYIGYITRRCFLKAPSHNLILVDHNEPRQSIMGIETANVLEIIDHHRLDSVRTRLPIFIDAEPLGSTCSIVYRQFCLHGLKPDRVIAKVLLTGLISDTLILRSPTTTEIDCQVARELAGLAGVEVQEYGLSMFSCMEGLKNRDPNEAIESDFKTYKENGVFFGIGQCEATTLADLSDYLDSYRQELDHIRQKNGLMWAVLMITDVIKENSVLVTTDFKANRNLRYRQVDANLYDMPGVMSRKKQLLPEIISSLSM